MIDFHTHTPAWHTATLLNGTPFGPDDFVGFMDRAGIDRAVVLAHDGLFRSSPQANEELAEFVAAYPDRLVGFGTYSPRHREAVDEIRRCFTELGLRGIKLHPWLQGFSVHEPEVDRLVDAVAEHGGIVLSHDGTPPYSTAGQLAALASRHPTVPLVLGHAGLHDLWRESLAAIQEYENVYACLCGTPPYASRRILEAAPPGKVVFGTDAGLSDRVSQDYAVARIREIDHWGIEPDLRQALLFDNPRRLLEVGSA
ncbi:amidohydrolase family protein [Kribbella sp. NPDC003505]|uniref:amidohydrolase family protein n=1 Tax=Kribbella sp. NPDC003505 TaxID=3154448 RepID=UPI0033B5A3E2